MRHGFLDSCNEWQWIHRSSKIVKHPTSHCTPGSYLPLSHSFSVHLINHSPVFSPNWYSHWSFSNRVKTKCTNVHLCSWPKDLLYKHLKGWRLGLKDQSVVTSLPLAELWCGITLPWLVNVKDFCFGMLWVQMHQCPMCAMWLFTCLTMVCQCPLSLDAILPISSGSGKYFYG